MKNFLLLLAKGLAIAVFVALGFCYFLWSFESVHRLIWFFVGLISIVLVKEYWKKTKRVIYYVEGQRQSRLMTKIEKMRLLLKRCCLAFLYGACMYGLGSGFAEIFNLSPEYWEVYIVYGVFVCFAMIGIGVFIAYVITLIKDSTERKNFLHALKLFAEWVIIIVCSLAVACIIIYYFLPLILES